MEFNFTLRYQLPPEDNDMDVLSDRLAKAGCDDALVGVGQAGRLALEFVREAPSVREAIESALEDVRRAVPGAHLIETIPNAQ
jgi:hypothetical protein